MFGSEITRRVTATLLTGLLIDAWTLEAALAARDAASHRPGTPAVITSDGFAPLPNQSIVAQAANPKRKPQAQAPATVQIPKVDSAAIDRYTQTLQAIAETLHNEEARGAIGRSSETGAVGPNIRITVKEPWNEEKANAVRRVLARARHAVPLEAAVERNFLAFDAHLLRHNLPSQIRERQHLAQTEFKSNAARFHRAVSALERGQTSKDATAANAAMKELAQIVSIPRLRSGNALPWGWSRPRQASIDVGELRKHALNLKPALLALNGSLSGIELPSAVPPESPGPDDLAPTEDAPFTSEIRQLAQDLGKAPVPIYNWVRNHIELVPGYGVMQGAQGTLQSRRGNAFDIASLLIALYRSAGIPARYVYGAIEVPADRVQQWLGADVESARRLLTQAGVPNSAVTQGGVTAALRLEHVWVKAWVDYIPSRGAVNREGDSWIPMDPAFKLHTRPGGFDLAVNVGINAFGVLDAAVAPSRCEQALSANVLAAAITAGQSDFRTRATQFLNTQSADLSVGQVLGSPGIVPESYSILLGTLPYVTVSEAAVMSELPDTLRWKLRLQLYASEAERGQGHSTASFASSLTALAGKRVTVSFVPATAADAQTLWSFLPKPHADGTPPDAAEFPATLPGYLIRMKAQIRIDGAVSSEGGSFVLGAPLLRSSGLFDPSQGTWVNADKALTAGDYEAYATDASGLSSDDLARLLGRAAGLKAALDAGHSGALTRDDAAGELLWLSAASYFGLLDASVSLLGHTAGMLDQPLPSYARAAAQLQSQSALGVVVGVRDAGIVLDAERLSYAAVPRAGSTASGAAAQAYPRTRAAIASAYANAALTRLFTDAARPGEALSALRALNQANSEGQALLTLDAASAARLDALELDSGVRADVRNALSAGQSATLSERPIALSGVAVSGVVIEDPQTLESVWSIAAGANGVTAWLPRAFALNWIALTEPAASGAGLKPALAADVQLAATLAGALDQEMNVRLSAYPATGALLASNFLAALQGASDGSACDKTALNIAAQLAAVLADASASLNHAPVITSAPATGGAEGQAYRYQLVASDADGDAIGYSLASAPGGATIDAQGLLRWDTPVQGRYEMIVRVTDGRAFIDQHYVLDVSAGAGPPIIDVAVNPPVADAGQSVQVTLSAAGGTGALTTSLTIDGQSVTLNGNVAAIIAAPSGVHRIVASVTDGKSSASIETVYSVRDPADTSTPSAAISAPMPDSEVTSAVNVVGNASAGKLAYWQLLVRTAEVGEWRELARGFTPVSNAVLARFDPSVLANDIYQLNLRVVDANGREASSMIAVEVTRQLKLGQFSLSFEDLNIEASGIPILITRTYDTRRRGDKLDFGYGWSVDAQNVVVRKNMTLGLEWEVAKPGAGSLELCLRPKGTRKINVTLPGGDVARFEARNDPECAFGQVPPLQIVFNPLPGTTAKMEPINVPSVLVQGGQLFDTDSFGPWNPKEFKLTTQEGFVFFITEAIGIVQIKDLSGNTFTYGANGIIHSNGQSIPFDRDAAGRIAKISDPSGKAMSYAYDADGDLISFTDRAGQTSRMKYNGAHGLISYTDARGVELIKHVYDEEGRLIAMLDASGNRIDIDHQTAQNKEVVKDRRGNATTYVYDAAGNVTQTIDALGNTSSTTYDAQGNELASQDPLGNLTTRAFDTNAKLVLTEKDPLGNTIAYTYNQSGQPTTFADAMGNVTNYVYFGNGGQSIFEPLGRISSLLLDNKGNLASLSVAGQTTLYTYDAKGNRTAEQDALGNVTSYRVDANGNETGRTWQRTLDTGVKVDVTTQRTLDAQGRVIAETEPLGFKTSTDYDAAGNVIAQTDAAGRKTSFEYDARGKLVRTVYPDGTFESNEFDAEGNEVASTDRQARVTRFEYDALNRLTRTIHPDGVIEQSTYDAAGRLVAQADPKGNATANTYDAAGRVIASKDALGRETKFEYDANGNRTKLTDALGRVTQFEYDALNRLVKTTWPDGQMSLLVWRLDGRKDSETDPKGNLTRYGYDALGRLTQVTQTIAGVDYITRYGYDEVGNKVTQSDAEGRSTRWAYDNAGRVIKRTLPAGEVETFSYDANGNVSAHTDFNGQVTRFAYDVNDRLITKLYPDGSSVSYAYTVAGQVQSITDARGTRTYVYDAKDRVAKVSEPDGSFIAYGYDANGNRTEVSPASGTTRYQYDANNRLVKVTEANGQEIAYTYDVVGNKTGVIYPNGTGTEYRYDAMNRTTEVIHRKTADGSVLLGLKYTLDAAGRRTQIDEYDAQGPARTTSYAYDEIYRLVREQFVDLRDAGQNRTAEYVYDKVGNRKTKTSTTAGGVTVTTYFYDNNDRLLREEASSGPTTTVTVYGYDANGNTISKSVGSTSTFYRWDAENRLVEVKQGASQVTATAIATYVYDGNGNRVTKTEATSQGNKVTRFLVDENQQYAQVLEERESQNGQPAQVSVAYLYGDDLLNQVRGGQRSYYHYDALGSTRLLTGQQASVTDSYQYEAFGNSTASSGNTTNVFRFVGEQFDVHVGMYYLRARLLDVRTGRFASVDRLSGQVERPITLNGYLYASDDPINALDPSGDETLLSLSSAMEAGVNLALQTVRSDLLNLVFDQLSASLVKALVRGGSPSVAVPGNPGAAALLSTLAVMCLNTKRKCLLKSSVAPTLVAGAIGHRGPMPATALHISAALYGFGNTISGGASPFLLVRGPAKNRGWTKSRCKTLFDISSGAVIGSGKAAGLDCDEYPYAATYQGGLANYNAGTVSLLAVPKSESGPQGGLISAFYASAPVPTNRPFINLAIPALPFSFYINRTGVHRF